MQTISILKKQSLSKISLATRLIFNKHADDVKHADVDCVIGLIVGSLAAFPYACVDPQININSELDIIQFAETWPNQHNTPSSKFLSAIYVNDRYEVTNKIGMEAQITNSKRYANGKLISNFKLLFGRSFDPKCEDGTMKNMTQLDIVDATTNFFRIFYKIGLSEVKKSAGRFIRKTYRIRHVVTIPLTWHHTSQDALKDAVTKAIIDPKNDIDKSMMFISETQAAALYCETVISSFNMTVDRTFMIIVAGGSTTKISVFTTVKSAEPGKDLLMIELIPSSEVNHGSSHLDAAFGELILKKFGRCGIAVKAVEVEHIIKQFSDIIKRKFLYEEYGEDIHFSIPSTVGVPSSLNDPKGPIRNGELVVTNDEMESMVFFPVVNPILEHIEKQFSSIPESSRNLDDVLLVGGFGESPYLFDKITERLERNGFDTTSIKKPLEGGLAVARGAVSYGLRPRLIPSDFIRHGYALDITNTRGHDFYFQEEDRFYNTTKTKSFKFRKYGVYYSNVTVQHPGILKFALYPLDRESSPFTATDLPLECEMSVNTLDIIELDGNDEVELQIRIETLATQIELSIIYKDNIISEKKIQCEPSLLLKYKLNGIQPIKRKRSVLGIIKNFYCSISRKK